MGNCCSDNRPTKEGELLIKDIISKMKIRELHFAQFDKIIQNNYERKKKNNDERQFLYQNYDQIVDQFFLNSADDNDYYKIQRNLIPDYEPRTFETKIYTNLFSLLNTPKYLYLEEVLKLINSKLDFDSLIKFFDSYIQFNLWEVTQIIRNEIYKEYSSFKNFTINLEFKQSMDYLANEIFSQESVDSFKAEILVQLKKLFGNRDNKVNQKFLRVLYNTMPYLFDILLLRNHFLYNNKSKFDSDCKDSSLTSNGSHTTIS